MIACIFSLFVSYLSGCAKIEDPVREISETEPMLAVEEKEYKRYSCELFDITLEQMLELFGLADVKYEEIAQEIENVTQHIMTFENGSYVIAEEEEGKLAGFDYTRNNEEEKVFLYGDNFLSEEDCSEELAFMTKTKAEEKCREELKRIGILSDLMVENVYGINQRYIMKAYAQAGGTGFGDIEKMTEEREAYQFRFQMACDGIPLYDGSISKGVLEFILQPKITIVYSIKGVEFFSMGGILDHIKPIGKATLISQQEAENIVLKAHGQAETEEGKGVITGAEVIYARVPVKIKAGKKHKDLSEYECIPCWKITMQQKITWDTTKKTELMTFDFLLQGDTGERLS